jgi:hypothetical protein
MRTPQTVGPDIGVSSGIISCFVDRVDHLTEAQEITRLHIQPVSQVSTGQSDSSCRLLVPVVLI